MVGRLGTPACVFRSCPRFGLEQAADGKWCGHCGRPLRGVTLGPPPGFQIEAFIDDGYYAEVFAVVDLATGVRVASKLYADQPDKRAAAAQEVTALQALAQPRVPALRASFVEGAWAVVVMTLVAGPDLRAEVTAQGPLSVPQVARLGSEACEVLAVIAERGWTYRDLHPRNLHRTTPQGTMLLDFDNARPPGWPAQMAGRAGYRAPELEGAGAVSAACDVYSLAGCLVFALTGLDPPEVPGPIPALRWFLTAWPAMRTLLDDCRDADPARRPGAAGLGAALRQFLLD